MSRPEDYTFFLDRSLGSHYVPEALKRVGASVELHKEHFDADAPDTEWITEVSSRDWVIVAKDLRIRWRPLEREAIQLSGARVFVFTSGNVRGPVMANAIARAVPRMRKLLDQHDGPFIAKVYKSADVRMWMKW